MPSQKQFIVEKNKEIADNIYEMTFKAPSICKESKPGQFVHIKCSNSFKPLLRRPFSIYKREKINGSVSIVYRVVGEGTLCLTKFKKGDKIDVLGPLGNRFSLPEDLSKVFVIAGGMGIAPISFLIDFIVEKKVKVLDNIEVIFGAKKIQDLILRKELEKKKVHLNLVTEDGSLGKKGTVVEVFRELVEKYKNDKCMVYASGPTSMFPALKNICESDNIYTQVSYENVMCCGVGACLGCVIKTRNGYKRVCKDGPVFELEQII